MTEIRRKDRDRIEYVGSMLGELRQMTNSDCCPLLSYFLDMAYLEARQIIDKDNGSGNGRNKRDAVA